MASSPSEARPTPHEGLWPEFDLLRAAAELTRKQQELLPLVAESLNADPYSLWMIERATPRPRETWPWWRRLLGRHPPTFSRTSGRTKGGPWRWHFHGLECDVEHVTDGRLVRIDFGPSTQRLTFTEWAVLQFVMTTRAPWPEFDALARYLSAKPSPSTSPSGDHAKTADLCDRLEALGLFVTADPAMCEARRRGAKVHTASPYRTEPTSALEAAPMDFAVCHRLVLAPAARALIEAGYEAFAEFAKERGVTMRPIHRVFPDAKLLTDRQREKLSQMIASALVELRKLGWRGEAEQAADLADAFHNLPAMLWSEDFSLQWFRRELESYERKHPAGGGEQYLQMLDEVVALEG